MIRSALILAVVIVGSVAVLAAQAPAQDSSRGCARDRLRGMTDAELKHRARNDQSAFQARTTRAANALPTSLARVADALAMRHVTVAQLSPRCDRCS